MESEEMRANRDKGLIEQLEQEEKRLQSERAVIVTESSDLVHADKERMRKLMWPDRTRAQHGRDIQLAKAKKKRRRK